VTASVSLPLFDFGQGAIKVEQATREQLKAEYTARLDEATADGWRTWQQCQLLREEIDTLDKRLPEFRKMADQAQRAYRAGNLAAATYVLMQTSRIARESELIDLRAALWSNALALRTLLGLTYAPATAEKSS
jgi:outer membrane protein TolC